MRQRRSLIVLLLVTACVSYAQFASAQSAGSRSAPSEEAKREASAHFHRGAELFQEGVYRAALVELQRAYEIAPNYRVLFNIGQTHVALGEFVEGKLALREFLEQGGSAIENKRRAEIEAQLAHLERRIATLEIQVDRVGATVTVDGKSVGTTPLSGAVSVNVGRHQVAAQSADGASASIEVDVAGGDRKLLPLVLKSAKPIVADIAPPPARAVAEQRALSKRQRWAVGVLASAGALAIAGGAVALLSKSAHEDYEKQLGNVPGDPNAIDEARDTLSRRSITADVLFGAAIAAGATGVVLLFVKRKDEPRETRAGLSVDLRLSARGIVAEGRF